MLQIPKVPFWTHFILIVLVQCQLREIQANKKFLTVVFDPFVSVLDHGNATKYGVQDIMVFVDTIHTEFDQVAVEIRADEGLNESSKYLIPNAVAEYNQLMINTSDNSLPMRVWLLEQPLMGNHFNTRLESFTAQILRLKDLALKSNKIFPGTVNTILLDYRVPRNMDLSITEQRIKKFIEIFENTEPEAKMDLGIVVSVDLCFFRIVEARNFFGRITKLPRLNYVFLYMLKTNKNIPENDKSTNPIKDFSSAIKMCFNSSVSKNNQSNHKIQIGLMTGASETELSIKGDVLHDNLVQFWGNVSGWAEQENVPVIMSTAFDQADHQRGWWQLEENVQYKDTSDYVFHSKRDLLVENKVLLDSSNKSKISFVRKNFGVLLRTSFSNGVLPIQIDETISNSSENFLPLVELISSKFGIVVFDSRDQISKSFLYACATYNNKFPTNESRKLQVIMLHRIKNIASTDEFNVALETAMEANEINKGTVPAVILRPDMMNFGFSPAFRFTLLKLLAIYRSNPKNSELQPKIGVMIPLQSCAYPSDSATFQRDLSLILPFIDMILFYEFVPNRENGVVTEFKRQTLYFEVCQSSVVSESGDRNISLGLFGRWIGLNNDRTENFHQVESYWHMINDWAVKTNNLAVMRQAIDTADKYNEEYYNLADGWWRLLPNPNYSNPREFIFKEKSTGVFSTPLKYQTESKSDKAENKTQRWLMVLLPSSLVIFALLVIAAATWYYLRIKRKSENEMLTQSEIDEFRNGIDRSLIDEVPYDHTKYELKKDKFQIDENIVLGEGEFGRVYGGVVGTITESDEFMAERNVAVKTPKKSSENFGDCVRGLLSEIKILSYLGEHENILELVGAYTERLNFGKLHVFLELCDGSLKSHLEILRAEGNESDNIEGFINMQRLDIRKDLKRWCCEIANGMEYVASRKVVHMDLAARNILLTSRLQVKIADFGLSRRLYQYKTQNKKKCKDEKLPWKWLSPEALINSEFTEKSDVWAFGVTMWEIYSLGKEPYERKTRDDMIDALNAGTRLEKLMLAQDTEYSIMMKCWELSPNHRPTFTQLKCLLDA